MGWLRPLTCCLGLLICGAELFAQEQPLGLAPPIGVASQSLTQTPQPQAPPDQAAALTPGQLVNLSWVPSQEEALLQVGLGYPDMRLRYNLSGPIDIEAKVAVEQGEQAYGVRLYWRAFHVGPVVILGGGEVGFLDFSSIDTLSGNGDYGELFVGAQWTFVKRWTALVDYGLARLQVRSDGEGVSQLQWVVNTALYYTLF